MKYSHSSAGEDRSELRECREVDKDSHRATSTQMLATWILLPLPLLDHRTVGLAISLWDENKSCSITNCMVRERWGPFNSEPISACAKGKGPSMLEQRLVVSLRKFVSRKRGRENTDSYNAPTGPELTRHND